MFTYEQQLEISDKIQQIIRDEAGNPGLPKYPKILKEFHFDLFIKDDDTKYAWLKIKNNGRM